MLEFVKAEMIVILLTIISLIWGSDTYLTIIFASLLMVLFCVRSFDDETGRGLWWVQLALSLAYCMAAGNVFSYIIFSELNTGRFKYLKVFCPALVYICVTAFMAVTSVASSLNLPSVLLNVLMLQVISGLLYLIEESLARYLQVVNEYSRIVTMSAINELYEKKLNRELVIKNYLSEKNARMEERENISRNIHNSVGHSIIAAIMALDAADMIFEGNPALAREKMHIAGDRIRTGMESIRQAVRVLDKSSESISSEDFVGALDSITDNFAMDTNIRIRKDYSYPAEGIKIPHEHGEFLTGALQELLTNGVKHGNADMFTVTLIGDSSHIRMAVADNGRCDVKEEDTDYLIKNGFGLKKIIAYVDRCGGNARIDIENGFKFEITLPILG